VPQKANEATVIASPNMMATQTNMTSQTPGGAGMISEYTFANKGEPSKMDQHQMALSQQPPDPQQNQSAAERPPPFALDTDHESKQLIESYVNQ